MSTPFDATSWPDVPPPSWGDEPPPLSDWDAPPTPEDEGMPPADPGTGEVIDKRGATAAPRVKKPKPDERKLFLDWVALHLSRVEAFGVPVKQNPAWCPEWWKHPEVVERFYVSWKGYLEATKRMQDDRLAQSAWWVQHWDHHARIIFDKTYGPFRACNAAGHLADNKGEPLTIVPEIPPVGQYVI
ncbi:DUF4913 domain-containing protein [Clavibacter californiensis]|nr:DUF4913 domain-containing protein [Clavibacter californiensis]UKF81693.1 DUF4913 domain-containing protein [Clavibacter californiensis]